MNLFNKSNMKQFEFLRYIAENVEDEHVTCKMSCIIRTDRLDTPYYMDIDISITHCTDLNHKGIHHAMDVSRHQRMYNLKEETYKDLESVMKKEFTSITDENISVNDTPDRLSVHITVMDKTELLNILNNYKLFFDKIDELA